jgi:hypothetical protein
MVLVARLEALEPLRTFGLSPVLVAIATASLALLGVSSGIGMWVGRKWGWWLGSFYYVYSVARNASALLTISALEDELAGGTRGPEYYYVKYGGRVVVHFLILLYFFRGNVLRYFALENLPKWKAVSTLIAVCAAIFVAASLFSE